MGYSPFDTRCFVVESSTASPVGTSSMYYTVRCAKNTPDSVVPADCKEKTTSFGVKSVRSQELYRAAQGGMPILF